MKKNLQCQPYRWVEKLFMLHIDPGIDFLVNNEVDLNFCILVSYSQSAVCQSCCPPSTLSSSPLRLRLQAPSHVWVAVGTRCGPLGVRGSKVDRFQSKPAHCPSHLLRGDGGGRGADHAGCPGEQGRRGESQAPELRVRGAAPSHRPLRRAARYLYSLVFCQLSDATVCSQISVFPQGREPRCPESLFCRAAGSNLLERRIR